MFTKFMPCRGLQARYTRLLTLLCCLLLGTWTEAASDSSSHGICGASLRAGEGLISSPVRPGVPLRYPDNVRCEWIIDAPRSRRVKLDFFAFNLQPSSLCGADYVKIITDGDNETADIPSSTVHCGDTLPPTILSTGNQLRLLFVTDGEIAGAGFSVFYQTVATDTPDAPILVWLEQLQEDDTGKLQSLPADPADYLISGNILTNTILQHQPAKWDTLDVDYHNRDFFWSDSRLKLIWHGQLDGEHLEAKPSYRGTSAAVAGLAVDWLARTVYWTDATYNCIMVSNYDGTKYRVVVEGNLQRPSGLAVQPQKGFLFWGERGNQPKIERSRLDGRDRQVLISSAAGYPIGITVDYLHDRIFWTASGLNHATSSIFSASIHGEAVTELMRVHSNQYVFNDLTVFKGYLFVTDLTNQLHCYLKDGNFSHYFSFIFGSRHPLGITTYANDNQVFQSSGCDVSPCEYLCVSDGMMRYSCLCPPGQHALSDGSCAQDSDVMIQPPKLFIVAQYKICFYPDNFPDMPLSGTGPSRGQCILSRLPGAVAISTDVRDGQLFYSTVGDDAIHSVRLRDNTNTVTVAEGLGGVYGIAVDWLAKLLYWTDSGLNHVAVSDYDGRYRKVLIKDHQPCQARSIVLDPLKRFLFYACLSHVPRIRRAGMDGSEQTVVVMDVWIPCGMVLDYGTKTLYFADCGKNTIESVDYMGGSRRKLFGKEKAMFTGLELYQDYLIWTEGSPNNSLNAVNRETGEYVRHLPLNDVVVSAHGVAMYADSRQPVDEQSPCLSGSHECQQLCLPAPLPTNFVCACAIGYTLDEDRTSCISVLKDLAREDFILVTDASLKGIFQIDLSSPDDPRLKALSLVNISNPLSVAYDHVQGMLYWSDVALGTISRALINGSHQEVVVTSDQGQVPYSLSVDSNSRLLFWTDVGTNTIKVSRLDGSHKRTIVNTSASPRALTTLANDGLLFWTWWGEDGAGIAKASMDGSDVVILLSQDEGFLNGIAADSAEKLLYWTDNRTGIIESMNFETGDNRQTRLKHRKSISRPFGIALAVNHVYSVIRGALYSLTRASGTTGGLVTYWSLDLARPNGITHSRSQGESTRFMHNDCWMSNGNCSGLCLPTPHGRTCADGLRSKSVEIGRNYKMPSSVPVQLEFANQPHDVILELGLEINQQCSSNRHSAQVVWKKDSIPLPPGQSDGIFVMSDGVLRILSVDETHQGLYTCTITGRSGSVIESTAEFRFNPDDVFLMTPETAVIPEGENDILTCAARHASYVIRWEKNGTPLQPTDMVHVISGDSLIIREAVVSDSGKYTCVAQTLGGVRVSETTAQVTVTSQQAVEEECGRVTSSEALGITTEDTGGTEEDIEDRTFRILGGTTAEYGSSPWIARLWLSKARKHYCGGSLLNRYWVLTGAHCITEHSVDKDDIKVRLGDHDSYSTEDSERLIGVQHIKVHDDFVSIDYDNDLALIKLAEPVERFTDYLRPLCLPSKSLARKLLKSGAKGKVVGWGQLVEEGPFPRYLTEVKVPIVGQRKCIDSTSYLVTKNMFCAGYKKKKGDACRGDSGGPFSVEHEGRWYQLGVVSWGEGCGREGKYGFYTRLMKFVKWIDQYMTEH